MKTTIFVTHRFDGLHHWPDAPADGAVFLRHPHRHLFHVRAEVEVQHDDRELEFFDVLDTVTLACGSLGFDLGKRSCEQIAQHVIGALRRDYGLRWMAVEVSEDGENGARVEA